MKTTERTLALVAALALVMLATHVPMGSLLLIVSLSALAVLFYPLGVALFNDLPLSAVARRTDIEGVSAGRKVGAIAAGMAFAVVCVGILFRVQMWPSGGLILLTGLALLVLLLGFLFVRKKSISVPFYRGIYIRLAILGLVGTMLFMMPTIVLVEWHYHNHPDYIERWKQVQEDPTNSELREQLLELQEAIAKGQRTPESTP